MRRPRRDRRLSRPDALAFFELLAATIGGATGAQLCRWSSPGVSHPVLDVVIGVARGVSLAKQFAGDEWRERAREEDK